MLVQAVETRFGAYFEVTKQFLLAIDDVTLLANHAATLKRNGIIAAKTAIYSLYRIFII